MLMKEKIRYKDLVSSVEHVHGYAEEGDWGEPRVTIVCGENGMIELSTEAMECLKYPTYIRFDFLAGDLLVTSDALVENYDVKETLPIEVTHVGSKGIIQKPDLVLEIAQKLNLDPREGMVHQMCISFYSLPDYVYLVVIDPRKALEEVPVVDSFCITDSNQAKKLNENEMLAIDNTLGIIRVSSQVYQALNQPSYLNFGIYKGYLVAITDQRYGLGNEVQFIGDEAMIQGKRLTDRITCKYGREDREGGTFRMAMVGCRKFKKGIYAFFALVQEGSQ